MRSNLLF